MSYLSFVEPVYALQRIDLTRYMYDAHHAEMLREVREMLADVLRHRLEPYAVQMDERDVQWNQHKDEDRATLTIAALWAGKIAQRAVLHGGPHNGQLIVAARDARGIPHLYWTSNPEPYPGAVYKRRGIDPENGAWHYYYEGS